jgi:uncharacterized glyoxalase superfamily protein PhnB
MPVQTQTSMFPFTQYEDALAAIDWLCDAFGFERREVHAGDDGTVHHAELSCGGGIVMLGTSRPNDFGLRTARELGAATSGVYLAVDDADAHYERARAAGAEILRELADTDYGSREYTARDPWGNVWSIGTYRPAP